MAGKQKPVGYTLVGDLPPEWRFSQAAFEQLLDGRKPEFTQMVAAAGEPWLLVVIDNKAHLARFPEAGEAEFRFLGSLDGGSYTESLRVDEDGDLLALEMRFEHPGLPGGVLTIGANNENDARSTAAIRKRCRRWAGRGPEFGFGALAHSEQSSGGRRRTERTSH